MFGGSVIFIFDSTKIFEESKHQNIIKNTRTAYNKRLNEAILSISQVIK